MGCVESSNERRPKRSESVAMRPVNSGPKAKGRQKKRNASLKRVDVGVQTELEIGGAQLLRRLSSRIKHMHRRSTSRERGPRQTEPPDKSHLFDLSRVVAQNQSRMSQYIDQALTMTGKDSGVDAGLDDTMPPNSAATTAEEEAPVSAREIQLIQKCWKEIEKDLVEFGADLFVRLLEENPPLRDLFPFGKQLDASPEGLSKDPDLRAHGLRVMETIGAAVDGLNGDWELIIPILQDLGARHKGYGATIEHFQPLQEAFVYSLRNGLPPKVFTMETEEAWKNLWTAVAMTMGETMRVDETYDENSNEVLISPRDMQLVQGCWKVIQKDQDKLGAAVFVRLLEQNPSIKLLFPFGKLNLPPDKLKTHPDLKAHAKGFMEALGMAVGRLDDLAKIVPLLEDLGARHKLYGAQPEHFKPLVEAFIQTLKNDLPANVLTPEVEEAWKIVLEVIAGLMSSTMSVRSEKSDLKPISAREKRLVQQCWRVVQKDMVNIGATLFVRLLEKNPPLQNLFPFGKLNLPPEKLKRNKELRAHGQRVMETIGAAVAGLDDVDIISTILEDLGSRHKTYGAKPEHFPPLVEALIYALKSSLPPKVFTVEVQEAWTTTMEAVATIMYRTMGGINVMDQVVVSPRDKKLVRASWKVIQKDLVNLGADLFVRLLEKNPTIGKLFTFGQLNLPSEKLKNHPDLRKHAKGVMETIGVAVAGLDDFGKTGPFLEDLGARHKLYGAKPEHFPAIQEAFMYAMKNGLSPKVFTSEVQEAWRNVLGVIDVTMSRTMRSDESAVAVDEPISSRDKALVRACWKVIQKDSVNLGAALFVRLLEKNPTIGKLFTFGQLNLPSEKLKNHPDLRKHAKGVMETIGMAVAGLDDLGKTGPFLEDLGARHKLYGAKPEHFPAIQEAFMYAMKNGLSPKVFTSEVQEAWRNVLGVIDVTMSRTMRSDESAVAVDEPISSRDKALVRACWKVIQKDSVNLGAALFVRLLEKNPTIGKLFTFGQLNLPSEKLKNHPDLRKHAMGVMETIGMAVAGLDDLGKTGPFLEDLGARHKLYGAKPEHFPAIQEAFMYAMKNGLSSKVFTSEVQEAWRNVLGVIDVTMSRTMRSDEPAVAVDEPISSRDKALVRACWMVIQKDSVNLGAALFVRLLEKNPTIGKLFTFGQLNLPSEKLKNHPDLRKHAKGVMETIGMAVAGLDDLGKTGAFLEDLGARHKLYGAKPEHFPALQEAFMYAMKNGLSSKVFTSEVQEAWKNVLGVIDVTMSRTMRSDEPAVAVDEPISSRDKALVRACWMVIQKDSVNLGAALFVRLLEKNPTIRKLFTFGQLNLPSEKLKNHPDLRKHAKGVMETIGMAVAGLDDLGKTGAFLEDLGARHKLYGAKPEHFPAIQEAFMYAMKNGLSSKVFTSEAQEAWRNVLGVIDVTMSSTMRSEETNGIDEGPISSRDKALVRACWNVIQKDLDNLGAALFVRLLEKNPTIGKLFTFGQLNLPSEKLKNHPDLRKHAKGVMETIGMAVAGLDDLGKTGAFLEDLGARHKLYGAKPEHFPAIQEAFMYAMKNGLSSKVFTSEAQEAWRNVLGVIDVTMSSTMRSEETNGIDEGPISSRDKALVRACWNVIQKDLDNLGAALFVRLLEKNPTIGKLFTFGQLNLPSEKLKNHPDLRKHAKGVMETIGMAVAGLDDLVKTGAFLEDLGARHKLYGAKPEHFPALVKAFMFSMMNGLSPKVFTSEVQEAWRNVLGVIDVTMCGTMRSDETANDEFEEVISTRHKELIRTCWKVIQQDLDNLGASVFTRLLDQNPAIGDLFPFGRLSLPPQMLKHNSDLRAHAKRFMETLGTVVDGLDDLGKIVPLLKDLGTKHRFTGATPEHFQPLVQAFMHSMRGGLSSKVFTADVQQAWGDVWKLVAALMVDTME